MTGVFFFGILELKSGVGSKQLTAIAVAKPGGAYDRTYVLVRAFHYGISLWKDGEELL